MSTRVPSSNHKKLTEAFLLWHMTARIEETHSPVREQSLLKIQW